MNNILVLQSIGRTYHTGDGSLTVLNGADLTLKRGEIVALVAPSGSGKSTLLHLAGLLEKPDGGAVIINGEDAGKLPDDARTKIRLHTIGIVYQFHHLLPEFSALENIALPQMIAGKPKAEAEARAEQLLAKLGLAKRKNHLPGKLSGGEQQRVAIARALANNPSLLLADEPTGNLDSRNSLSVLHILRDLNERLQQTILMITHNAEAAAFGHRMLHMSDGRIVESPAK